MNNIEVIWGHRLLDEGFTSIPNILIRNYRKLGITHGEWGLICTILTYKHDERDPYPSQETLATHMEVDIRQIKKWVQSLVEKNLLLVGQRRNTKNKQFGNAVYNFNPMIQAALKIVGEAPLPPSQIDWDVKYRKPSELQVPTEPEVLQVPPENELQVPPARDPQVPPKITSTKKQKNEKNNNTDHVVAVIQERIESHLGKSIKSLVKEFPAWIDTYGEDKLVSIAKFIGDNSGKWNNIVGAYRAAIERAWEIDAISEVAVTNGHDERYAAFYKLFPDN